MRRESGNSDQRESALVGKSENFGNRNDPNRFRVVDPCRREGKQISYITPSPLPLFEIMFFFYIRFLQISHNNNNNNLFFGDLTLLYTIY